MKTRDEAEEKSVEMVLSSLPDHPKSYIEGFRDCFDWLNEAEQSGNDSDISAVCDTCSEKNIDCDVCFKLSHYKRTNQEQSEPNGLTADDFVKVRGMERCNGCYFNENRNCNSDLCEDVWVRLEGCGTVKENYIFKLKEAKQ